MKLYGYWRSSAAYRVRIALNLKKIDCELISVHLVKDGGQQHSAEYAEMNPNELVPTLLDGDFKLNQSMAILEYLERQYPQTPLLPKDLKQEMTVRAIANDIACDIHPLNNLRVLQYLASDLGQDDTGKASWYRHWVEVGFRSLEITLAKTHGQYCVGDQVTWADICLVPQVYNAERFKVDMTAFPIISQIAKNCRELSAFHEAAPEQQADAT